jgi:hypothetical protein
MPDSQPPADAASLQMKLIALPQMQPDSPPLVGRGWGWGDSRPCVFCNPPTSMSCNPPTLSLPHKGGGDDVAPASLQAAGSL